MAAAGIAFCNHSPLYFMPTWHLHGYEESKLWSSGSPDCAANTLIHPPDPCEITAKGYIKRVNYNIYMSKVGSTPKVSIVSFKGMRH